MSLDTVHAYHERTKHHPDRYARSLGYLDWATQPDPFRRFEGAQLLRLELPVVGDEPTYDSLFSAGSRGPAPLTPAAVSLLFRYSLGLSAWKQVRRPDGTVDTRWPLRVNPSSGNLHPTEGHLICGPLEGLCESAAVYHYAPLEHGLELRRRLENSPLPPGALFVGLTSVHWREAWKYGERAYRYCQHDVGHAIGALALSAAALGWTARLVEAPGTEAIAALLGVANQEGVEAEHADCLLALNAPDELPDFADLTGGEWHGNPNQLSTAHHEWPVIDEVSAAAASHGGLPNGRVVGRSTSVLEDRGQPAHRLILERRSAVAMDGETSIARDDFFRMMRRVMPDAASVPFATLGWEPKVSLGLFVHRVEGLAAGLYLLARQPAHEASLRRSLRSEFRWERAPGCPDEVPLYLLAEGDARGAAREVSCHQDIAGDGAFSVGMLAAMDDALQAAGPAMYPRLFWETGLIGQILYLEAEAAGVRGTGIGCFFDDVFHRVLGISGNAWQSLYHFTVGGPVEDPRIETTDAYAHRKPGTI